MKNDENWIRIFKTPVPHKAEVAKQYLLEHHSIVAVVMNRQDSSYPIFGMIELYVSPKDANIAKIIIENELYFDQPI